MVSQADLNSVTGENFQSFLDRRKVILCIPLIHTLKNVLKDHRHVCGSVGMYINLALF